MKERYPNIDDPNFVANLNSVNKELGFHETRQPCKEYLLAQRLIRRGFSVKEINKLNLEQLKQLVNE